MSVKSALTLYQECCKSQRSISFGCPLLDQSIGPIQTQGITEIAGEAGCGKTQLCLVLALQVLIQSNLEGSVAIMCCGEGIFPMKRLVDLAGEYESQYPPYSAKELLDKVHIMQCRNHEEAIESINKVIPEMCRRLNVRLLVLDSLAGLIRFEYDVAQEHQMRDRTVFLFNFARQLKWISDIHHTAIVVVNQVTSAGFDREQREDDDIVPALGLVWSTCVTTRILLSKSRASRFVSLTVSKDLEGVSYAKVPKQENEKLFCGTKPTRRSIRIDFSPSYPQRSADFVIRHDGIKGIS